MSSAIAVRRPLPTQATPSPSTDSMPIFNSPPPPVKSKEDILAKAIIDVAFSHALNEDDEEGFDIIKLLNVEDKNAMVRTILESGVRSLKTPDECYIILQKMMRQGNNRG
jgi:hypothetical protein